MIFINLIKVAGIWLCDIVNKVYDPFIKIGYDVQVDLGNLERLFYQQLKTSYVENGRFKYQLPMPEDDGDAALFQGLYTAMMNFKHKEPTSETQQANAAMGSFFVDGRLIRGVRSDGTINDTTSNDSATGMLFGLYSIWLRSTWEADATIQRWAYRIVDSGYSLTNLDGVPTQYGQLEQGWKTDPLRLTLLLTILALAARTNVTNPNYYKAHYDKLYTKYRLLLRYPKVKLLWWDTDYDTHRAAIHLHILYSLTNDELYADGLRRIHRITRNNNNAWVELLCRPAVPAMDVDLSILHTFNFWRRLKGNVESINSTLPGAQPVTWGGKIRSKYVQPIANRGSQEFFWQRNMFSMDEWVGNAEAGVYHCGLDFLLAYWFAVRLKLLSESVLPPATGPGVV